MAFFSIEPFGMEVDMLGHAITASTIANVNRRKGRKPYDVEDFMPKFEKQNQTPEQMIQLAEMFTGSMGGLDLREENSDGG
jgi:hypothetical protein